MKCTQMEKPKNFAVSLHVKLTPAMLIEALPWTLHLGCRFHEFPFVATLFTVGGVRCAFLLLRQRQNSQE